MQKALTIRGEGGLLRALISQVGVCVPFLGNPTQQEGIKVEPFSGVWDTGATGSAITVRVAQTLGLKPTGLKEVRTANGTALKNTYLVNFILPGDVMIQHVEVTEGDMEGIDILIGMDIITLGDFSITNRNGVTVMSFRIPSSIEVDYVAEVNRMNHLERSQLERRTQNIARKNRIKNRKKR